MQAESTLGELAFHAEGGDAGAQYRLGVLFLLGQSVEQDLEAAHRWLTRAAANQYPGAFALTEKLAVWRRLEAERQERSLSFPVRARDWMMSVFVSALRLYREEIQSSSMWLLQAWTDRAWKSQAKNLVSKVRFQFQAEAPEFPARRREGFQFRDSL
jgi:TPR repeat protein